MVMEFPVFTETLLAFGTRGIMERLLDIISNTLRDTEAPTGVYICTRNF